MIVSKPRVSPDKIHCRCPSCEHGRNLERLKNEVRGIDQNRLAELFLKAVREVRREEAGSK
jgi:hypothetical protein